MKTLTRWCALLGLSLLSISSTQAQQSVPPAPPESEVRAEISGTEALLPRLADRGAALYLMATDYATLGDTAKALGLLKECIDLGEGFDPSADPAFATMRTNPEFRALAEKVVKQFPAVHRAQLVFTVPEKDLIPEGLAADATGHVFYMSSLNRRKVVQIKDGVASDFVKAGVYGLLPVIGLKIDPKDGGLWADTGTDSDGQSELVHFDPAGKLVARVGPPTPGKHLFNDLVLSGEREIYLTNSLANVAYRFDRQTSALTALKMSRALYYPNGITLSGDGNQLFVADAFGVLRYDLRDGSSSEVRPGPGVTLAGVDGMYWDRGWLVLVQNGIGLPRVARFLLSADGTQVTRSEILEYRSDLVELPTTGTIVQGKFYFICNTQIDNLKNEKIVDPTRLQPVRVAAVALQ